MKRKYHLGPEDVANIIKKHYENEGDPCESVSVTPFVSAHITFVSELDPSKLARVKELQDELDELRKRVNGQEVKSNISPNFSGEWRQEADELSRAENPHRQELLAWRDRAIDRIKYLENECKHHERLQIIDTKTHLELMDLRRWKTETLKVWGPVMRASEEIAQKSDDVLLGDSISEYAVRILSSYEKLRRMFKQAREESTKYMHDNSELRRQLSRARFDKDDKN